MTYSSTKASQQTITASYGGDPIHETSSGSTTVTVKPGPPAKVIVDPPAATNPVDTEHCVTATVTDRFDNPTPNITVVFSVTGSNTASGSGTTGSDGKTAPFCYTGALIGITDVITAFADFNPKNGTQDPGEPVGVATKIWEIPVSTPLCEVIVTQGGWIIARNGDRATFGGNAQVSSTGEPNGQEEYQDHGPAQPMNVKSTKILAVTCSDDLRQASVFGLATIDGSGEFAFRIDVRDLGEPGVGQDTYRMRILAYDSGEPGRCWAGTSRSTRARASRRHPVCPPCPARTTTSSASRMLSPSSRPPRGEGKRPARQALPPASGDRQAVVSCSDHEAARRRDRARAAVG